MDEEAQDYRKECAAKGTDTIFLASPATGLDRLRKISALTKGYLYSSNCTASQECEQQELTTLSN